MKLALSLLAALLAFTGSALAQTNSKPADCGALPESWTGTAFAIDGDTLAGVGLKPHIRIWGIQAPELRDAGKQQSGPGMRARVALDQLISPTNQVTCRIAKFDRYCRFVAQCFTTAGGGEVDLGAQMLRTGNAYGFYLEDTLPWATDAGLAYIALERAARTDRRGFWLDVLGKR